jgi:hypothetical protein
MNSLFDISLCGFACVKMRHDEIVGFEIRQRTIHYNRPLPDAPISQIMNMKSNTMRFKSELSDCGDCGFFDIYKYQYGFADRGEQGRMEFAFVLFKELIHFCFIRPVYVFCFLYANYYQISLLSDSNQHVSQCHIVPPMLKVTTSTEVLWCCM